MIGNAAANTENAKAQGKISDLPNKMGGSILRYPLDIDRYAQNYMKFEIVDRQSLVDKKSIYLYTPQGVSVPDSASYNQADLGLIGGAVEAGFEEFTTGGRGGAQNAADLTGAVVTKAIGKGGGIGQAGLIGRGVTANPFTNVSFQGTTLRSFNFNFKLVSESQDEAEQARLIENTFRKFLYPSTESTDFLLKYPPFFKIEFLSKSGDEMKVNKFMPFIGYCYLLNMTTTFNESTNLFHSNGEPTEVSLSLTFQESKAMLRDDLYTSPDNYNSADYTSKRSGVADLTSVIEGD